MKYKSILWKFSKPFNMVKIHSLSHAYSILYSSFNKFQLYIQMYEFIHNIP